MPTEPSILERKFLPPEQLVEVRERLRSEGRVVVQCHGCFDIVHPGHIRYLRFARELGDVLIVSVSADDVVGKGFDRPYINEDLRIENLAALEFVDYLYLDHNSWAGPVLELLKPDIYVKGKEYETNADPRFLKEKELVEGQGGRVMYGSGDVVYSSSTIIGKYRQRFGMEQERVNFFCRRHGVDGPALGGLLDAVDSRRVLVIGDAILDRYVHCATSSVANESPMLSVRPVGEDWYLGGAALIARQLQALGADASLLTTIGPGEHGDRFTAGLAEHSVELLQLEGERRPVYVKTRYLVEETKVFKVDEGRQAPLSTQGVQALAALLEQQLPRFDAVIITDFGYGMFGPECVRVIEGAAQRHELPIYVDVSISGSSSILKFRGARMATPSEEELRFALGDNESGLSNLASRYFAECATEKLVLTMGKRGVVIFHRSPQPGARLRTDHVPAFATHILDTVGAGDVLLAAQALADVVGASAPVGLYLGSCLAALQVSRIGNDPVSLDELRAFLEGRSELRQG